MLPTQYRPRTLADFIGPARTHAATLEKILAASLPTGAPVKALLLGPPGVGKTGLGNYVAARLGVDRWSTHQYNGTQLKLEQVEEIARSLHFKDMFGKYRLLRIEEVDQVPRVAQVRLLSLLDDLPEYCAVVCTSNCREKDLEERFQSRFLLMQVGQPPDSEIKTLLKRLCADLRESDLNSILLGACGNVRAALADAQHALLAR